MAERESPDQAEMNPDQDVLRHLARTADGVWAVDSEQRIVLWNVAAEELLGYPAEQALGQLCHELLSGRDPQGERVCQNDCAVLACAAQGQLPASFSMQVRSRDGHATWIDISIIVLPEGESDERRPRLVHLFRRVGEGRAWCPPLRIHLLGPIVVERADGSRVGGPHWRRAKVRALLGLLALQRGRPVHRDVLVQTLWPELDYDAALHSLNSTVYRLRRSLEPALEAGGESHYIRYEADHYELEGGRAHWLDVDAFLDGLSGARRDADPEQAVAAYRQALALYRGELLAGLQEEDEWLQTERERLAERYLAGLEEVGTLLARQGRYAESADQYLQALALDPCRETAVRRLMRLALRRGDRAAAVAHYRRLEAALWRELEMLPSAESCLLYEEALRGG